MCPLHKMFSTTYKIPCEQKKGSRQRAVWTVLDLPMKAAFLAGLLNLPVLKFSINETRIKIKENTEE